MLLDRYGHMKISDFGLCKHLGCTSLPRDNNVTQAMNCFGAVQTDMQPFVSKNMPSEQIGLWKKNQRASVS